MKLVVKWDWCFGRQDFVTSLRPQRDGRGLAFVDGDTEANVWVQPLDGRYAIREMALVFPIVIL